MAPGGLDRSVTGAWGGGALAALAVALATTAPLTAQSTLPSVARAESRLSGRVVPDISIVMADGRRGRLSDLWDDKPLLLTFYYRRCAGICVPFLEWVRDAVRDAGGLGRDYRVLALTFDDTETVVDLRAQASALGLIASPEWSFATADPADVAQVAAALDFGYRLDPDTRQYEHQALLAAVDRGRVIRAQLGTPASRERLRELVWDARGVFVPAYRVPDGAALRCVTVDPRSGETRLDWGLLVLALPGLAAAGLALATFGSATRPPPRI
jgi:cytochrome oxidase Cu insertion factor (SCO1/SenC/PrrC family)